MPIFRQRTRRAPSMVCRPGRGGVGSLPGSEDCRVHRPCAARSSRSPPRCRSGLRLRPRPPHLAKPDRLALPRVELGANASTHLGYRTRRRLRRPCSERFAHHDQKSFIESAVRPPKGGNHRLHVVRRFCELPYSIHQTLTLVQTSRPVAAPVVLSLGRGRRHHDLLRRLRAILARSRGGDGVRRRSHAYCGGT